MPSPSRRPSSRWTSACRPTRDSASEGFRLLEQMLALDPEHQGHRADRPERPGQCAEARSRSARTISCAKPFDPDLLGLTIDRAYRLYELQAENARLQALQPARRARRRDDARPGDAAHLPQRSRRSRRAARRVLLLGESGTGKEVLAQALHHASKRARRASSRSTAPRFRRTCSRASCSATRRARSPAPSKTDRRQGRDRQRRHADARRDRRPAAVAAGRSCCASCRSARSSGIGGRQEIAVDVRVVCATHQDLKGADPRAAASAKTCTTGSPRSSSRFRRCARARATRCCSRMRSCAASPKSSSAARCASARTRCAAIERARLARQRARADERRSSAQRSWPKATA